MTQKRINKLYDSWTPEAEPVHQEPRIVAECWTCSGERVTIDSLTYNRAAKYRDSIGPLSLIADTPTAYNDIAWHRAAGHDVRPVAGGERSQ